MNRWQVAYRLSGEENLRSTVVYSERIDWAIAKVVQYIERQCKDSGYLIIKSATLLPPPKLKAEPLPDLHA